MSRLLALVSILTFLVPISACFPDAPDTPAADAGAPPQPDAQVVPDLGPGPEPVVDAGPDMAPEPVVDAGPAPSACPPALHDVGSRTRIELSHDGRERSYVLYVGESVDLASPTPLVMNFHGANNSPALQESFSQMNSIADREGFIVAYPQGISASFNAGSCCGTASSRRVDDVGFTRAILADIHSRLCVDTKRVFATGFSNGGFMSHRLACEMADVFGAVASVAGANGAPACEPSRAIPVLGIHGTTDFVIPFSSGRRAAVDWAERNGCDESPTRERFGSSYCDRWSGCEDGASVEFCSASGWTHLWPTEGSSIPASSRIWEFFEQHPLD